LFLAVFGAFVGQFILFPILPPLARELGLSEFQTGLLVTTAALMLFLASPVWGRRSDLWGRKPVLLAGMIGGAISFYVFAFVVQVGLAGALSVPLLFVLMVLTRGLLYGVSIAAVPVSAQAYVADATTGERERTSGIAALGAAQSLPVVVGPALGGLLAGVGLLFPLYFAPTLVLIIAVLVWWLLPAPRRQKERESPPRPSPFDGRMWPFLIVGQLMFLSLGAMLLTVGFLYQDRLGLPAQETAQVVGLALFVTGFVLVFTQAALIPRMGWPPLRLMRAGIPVAATGFLTLVFAGNFPTLTLGLALTGLGLGLAVPGYTAAPTLLFGEGEQGGVAGLISANNALAFVLGPTVGSALYGVHPTYPYLFSTLLCVLLFVFVLLHPSVRQVASSETLKEAR
jgi:MFS family permease